MLKSEIETTINIYGDDKVARIYTCDYVWIKRLKKIVDKDPQNCLMNKRDEDNYFFRVPVSYIKVITKRERKPLTEEHKRKLLETAAKARELKKQKELSDVADLPNSSEN